MSSTSMNFRATVSSSVTRQVTREYIVNPEKCKSAGIPVVYRLSGFLPVPRVTASSAGRRSCQGWPEATAERLGLDGEKPCGHFPGSEGQLARPGWQYRGDEIRPWGWGAGLCPGIT